MYELTSITHTRVIVHIQIPVVNTLLSALLTVEDDKKDVKDYIFKLISYE